MYIWNVNGLARDLKGKKVSQYDQALYYIGLASLILIPLGLSNIIGYTNVAHILFTRPWLTYSMLPIAKTFMPSNSILLLIDLALLIWGTLYCYRQNKKGDNKDFLLRLMCLSFPSTIRFLILKLVFVLPLRWDMVHLDTLLISGLLIIMSVCYYFYLGRALLVVAGGSRVKER